MSRFVASDQFRQMSLLRRRQKVQATLQRMEGAQNKAETSVST